jgi:hypothetical protein
MVLLTALVICSLLVSFYNSTGLDIYLVSIAYIAFAYGLFAVLIAVNIPLWQASCHYLKFNQLGR